MAAQSAVVRRRSIAPVLAADLGARLVAGLLLARRSARLLMLTLVVSAAAGGAGVHFLAPELTRYRGASGIASALAVACALDLGQTPGPPRRAATAGLLLFAAKLISELATGTSILPGTFRLGSPSGQWRTPSARRAERPCGPRARDCGELR